MKHTVDVTESNFETVVLQSPLPVLVDFWADWCGPCKMIAPVLEDLARDWQGRALVAKVHVDQNPGLAARYDIQSIPSLLLFADGEVKSVQVGATSRRILEAKLQALQAPAKA